MDGLGINNQVTDRLRTRPYTKRTDTEVCPYTIKIYMTKNGRGLIPSVLFIRLLPTNG